MKGEEESREQEEGYVTLKGFINDLDLVGRQQQYALVVLNFAEKDGYNRVPLDARNGALGQENVGLVEEENSLPVASELENVRQPLMDLRGLVAEGTARHGVQRHPRRLRYRLRRERFSRSWRAKQQADEAFTLAFDEIVKHGGALTVGDDELVYNLLEALVHDERVKDGAEQIFVLAPSFVVCISPSMPLCHDYVPVP